VAEKIGSTLEGEFDLNGQRCLLYGQDAPSLR
jgi:hypothetical protein